MFAKNLKVEVTINGGMRIKTTPKDIRDGLIRGDAANVNQAVNLALLALEDLNPVGMAPLLYRKHSGKKPLLALEDLNPVGMELVARGLEGQWNGINIQIDVL